MYISLVIGPFRCKPISMRAMVLEYRDWLPILLLSNEECKLCFHGDIFQTGNESFPRKRFHFACQIESWRLLCNDAI